MLNLLGLSDHDAETVVGMMSEPHRFYHTVTHVLSVIGSSPDPMIWALGWFHDVIYDTARADNELRSAEFGVEMLSRNNRLGIDLRVFYDAVIDTATHKPRSPISEQFCDRDMGILAASPRRYYTYRSQIRSEYIHVPWEVYATARSKILTDFNERKIFYTREFADKEPLAHQNIEREIDDLRHCDELDFVGMFL